MGVIQRRIKVLSVENPFTSTPKEGMAGLLKCEVHVYCVF